MAVVQKHQHISAIVYISVIIAGFAFILNIIGIYFIRKQGSQRTHQRLIILHLSILQVPILICSLVYWISRLFYVIMHWTIPLLISFRIAINLIIAILTADRLLAIKYSLRYLVIVTKRKIMLALITQLYN